MSALPSSINNNNILKAFNIPNIEKEVTLSTNHCPNFIERENVQELEIVFTIYITSKVFRSWYDHKDGDVLKSFSYIQIVNALISQYHVKIKEDCDRIEGRLRRVCSETKSKSCKNKGGRKRCKLMQSVKSVAVHYHELADLEEQFEYAEHSRDVLSKENEELQTRCEKLYHDLHDVLEAEHEREQELENIQIEYDKVLNQNMYLNDYIEKTGLAMDLCNDGKTITGVKERQQRRKIKELKTSVEKALWFAETYGVKLTSASFCDDNGKDYDLNFNETSKIKGGENYSISLTIK